MGQVADEAFTVEELSAEEKLLLVILSKATDFLSMTEVAALYEKEVEAFGSAQAALDYQLGGESVH